MWQCEIIEAPVSHCNIVTFKCGIAEECAEVELAQIIPNTGNATEGNDVTIIHIHPSALHKDEEQKGDIAACLNAARRDGRLLQERGYRRKRRILLCKGLGEWKLR